MALCDEVVHLRRAREDDARGIAEVHVATFRDAYRDCLPAPYLQALTVDDRERYWARELSTTPADRRPWVAETDDQIVGFASGGGSHGDDAKSTTGEVYAIFVLPDCWDRGLGRNLLAHVERDLLHHGYSEAVIWVAADNDRARYFHEKQGWHADGATKTSHIAGEDVAEMRYRITLDKSRVAETV